MKTSTNALTKRYCALVAGWPCETVQSWRGRQRHDAFGIGDSLILTGSAARLVQNCSYGTLKAHRDAIDANPITWAVLSSGLSIELWEWRRRKLKRGGTRKGREWWVRMQTATEQRGWLPVGQWMGPFDLYPKKPKPKKGKAKRAKFEPTYNLVDMGSGGGLDYAGLISGHGYDS